MQDIEEKGGDASNQWKRPWKSHHAWNHPTKRELHTCRMTVGPSMPGQRGEWEKNEVVLLPKFPFYRFFKYTHLCTHGCGICTSISPVCAGSNRPVLVYHSQNALFYISGNPFFQVSVEECTSAMPVDQIQSPDYSRR